MRLHDEHWWKCGRCQTLCMNDMHPWALKPSHTMKACVLSTHVKFRPIQSEVEGISTLTPFTAQCATLVDNGIGDGIVGRCSMVFQESFEKDSIDGNGEWWQQDCMMNIDENMEYLVKDYVGMTCILEPWNPPIARRHVSYLTMPNSSAYMLKLKEFQRCPHSHLNVRRRWIMALVTRLLEDVPWHFKIVSTNIPLVGTANDVNETTWWMLMKTWTILKIMWAQHAYLSLEALPHHEGMCLS